MERLDLSQENISPHFWFPIFHELSSRDQQPLFQRDRVFENRVKEAVIYFAIIDIFQS